MTISQNSVTLNLFHGPWTELASLAALFGNLTPWMLKQVQHDETGAIHP